MGINAQNRSAISFLSTVSTSCFSYQSITAMGEKTMILSKNLDDSFIVITFSQMIIRFGSEAAKKHQK